MAVTLGIHRPKKISWKRRRECQGADCRVALRAAERSSSSHSWFHYAIAKLHNSARKTYQEINQAHLQVEIEHMNLLRMKIKGIVIGSKVFKSVPTRHYKRILVSMQWTWTSHGWNESAHYTSLKAKKMHPILQHPCYNLTPRIMSHQHTNTMTYSNKRTQISHFDPNGRRTPQKLQHDLTSISHKTKKNIANLLTISSWNWNLD